MKHIHYLSTLFTLVLFAFQVHADDRNVSALVQVKEKQPINIKHAGKSDQFFTYAVEYTNGGIYGIRRCTVVAWVNKNKMVICDNPSNVFVFNDDLFEIRGSAESLHIYKSESNVMGKKHADIEKRLIEWRDTHMFKAIRIPLTDILKPIKIQTEIASVLNVEITDIDIINGDLTIKFQVAGEHKGTVVLDKKFAIVKVEIIAKP